jgi:CBS domain-containing protein
VQVRDVMTREVVTVGPDSSTKQAGAVMAERGFAALPVVDESRRVVGMVAEADVLRDRVPADPRLHMRRDRETSPPAPPMLVRDVMSAAVRSIAASADVADLARLLVGERLRSLPVLEDGVLVGIVSRRDVLRVLVRPDEDIRADLVRLVEGYTGELGCWDIVVVEGAATIRRSRGAPEGPVAAEDVAMQELAATVPGVVAATVLHGPPAEEGRTPFDG